jgi:superfamily I DNA and/or RNA helicase
MAGDPQQLPPTVKSAAGLQAGLDCTLFTRLADLGELKPCKWIITRNICACRTV